jgi:hypothetical protein
VFNGLAATERRSFEDAVRCLRAHLDMVADTPAADREVP